ncbi:hypothetical protein [Caudoviricetes sp.]|nr:hypothetical protein [Caudoviricetes sp.]
MFFLLYALHMNTQDQAEYEASEALLDYAISLVKEYTDHPGDFDAATKALLVTTLEHLFNRRIYIEQL